MVVEDIFCDMIIFKLIYTDRGFWELLMGSNNFTLVVCVRYKMKEEEVKQQTEDSFSYLLIIFTGPLYCYLEEIFIS
jgi:hypothetical protein